MKLKPQKKHFYKNVKNHHLSLKFTNLDTYIVQNKNIHSQLFMQQVRVKQYMVAKLKKILVEVFPRPIPESLRLSECNSNDLHTSRIHYFSGFTYNICLFI